MEPASLLETVGYVAVLVPWLVGIVVIAVCAWKGAKSYIKELEKAREEKLLFTGKE
jgi:hypothetical protein